jgi:hypothetical protein
MPPLDGEEPDDLKEAKEEDEVASNDEGRADDNSEETGSDRPSSPPKECRMARAQKVRVEEEKIKSGDSTSSGGV